MGSKNDKRLGFFNFYHAHCMYIQSNEQSIITFGFHWGNFASISLIIICPNLTVKKWKIRTRSTDQIIKCIFNLQSKPVHIILQTTLLLQYVIVYSIDRSITYSMKCFKVVSIFATSTFCTNLQNIHERKKLWIL